MSKRDELIKLIAEGLGCAGHYNCSRPPSIRELAEASEELDAYLHELAELAKLKAPVVGYLAADGRCYHPDDIAIVRDPAALTSGRPEYEAVVLQRVLGCGVQVLTAPQHAKITPEMLTAGAVRFEGPSQILLADQVSYRITGWDQSDSTLTLELVHDHRPSPGPGSEATG